VTHLRRASVGFAFGAALEAVTIRVLAHGDVNFEVATAFAVAIPVVTALSVGLLAGVATAAVGIGLTFVFISNRPLDAALAVAVALATAALAGHAAHRLRRLGARSHLLERCLDVARESVSDAVIGLDLDGTISTWSPRAARLYGYSAEQAVGRPFASLFGDGSATAIDRLMEHVREGQRVHPDGLVHRHADGRELSAKLTVIPVLIEDAGAVGAYAITTDIAEHLRLTEAVNESESRRRALVEQLPVTAYRRALEHPHAWMDVSSRVDSLLGFSVHEWLGDGELFSRLVHPDDRDRVIRQNRAAEPFCDEYRMYARDGRLVWVRDESAVVRDKKGRPLYVQGYLLDISDEKARDAERERVRAAERAAVAQATEKQKRIELLAQVSDVLASPPDYERAIQKVADIVVRHVADWCVVTLVDAKGDLAPAGIAHAEPTSPRVVHDDEHAQIDESAASRVIETGKAELGESYLCLPLSVRGRAVGVLTLISAKPTSYSSDDLTFVEDIARRIAAAVDSAQLYKEVEERAEAARVMTYVADGVFLVDRSGVIRLWNPAAEAITGFDAATVVGRIAGDVLPDWDRLAERIPISQAPEPTSAEKIPLETPKGERWISISGVDFFGGTVYAFRDFTEERRLEELKADFVATASHELRTPLAAVYGAAQTLRRHDFALDEAGRDRFVSLIAEESERLSRIVNEILLANQLDAGRVDVIGEPFDPLELVERVGESARAHLPPAMTLEIVPPSVNATVAADREKVRQVLVNLVENAIKYSPDGGTVQMGLETGETTVRFWVEDNGLGIPPEEQARIFDKFYRVDPEMIRGVGGTGLGLYICSELVARMGGNIAVQSDLGEGSVFSFELPVGEAAVSRVSTGDPATTASA
jgi:PAS domain S-box-containing protein